MAIITVNLNSISNWIQSTSRLMCYMCRMNDRLGYFKNTQLVVSCAGMWPSSLIRREAGEHACDITGGKSRSF